MGEISRLAQTDADEMSDAILVQPDCFSTGCCDIVGYTCYQTKPGAAKCMKNCTPSASQLCTQPQSIMEPVLQDAYPVPTSLYCFSVYTENTGTTKKTEELETLQYQFSKGLSIFACEEHDVFADVEVEVGPGLQTKRNLPGELQVCRVWLLRQPRGVLKGCLQHIDRQYR